MNTINEFTTAFIALNGRSPVWSEYRTWLRMNTTCTPEQIEDQLKALGMPDVKIPALKSAADAHSLPPERVRVRYVPRGKGSAHLMAHQGKLGYAAGDWWDGTDPILCAWDDGTTGRVQRDWLELPPPALSDVSNHG